MTLKLIKDFILDDVNIGQRLMITSVNRQTQEITVDSYDIYSCNHCGKQQNQQLCNDCAKRLTMKSVKK
jgi:hypothetical protein